MTSEVMGTASETAWERGRFDARPRTSKVLFGRMYEDASIELNAFKPGGRVFCIASAGCTAMKLAPQHEVVAVDLNPVQLTYAEGRFAGRPSVRGTAERVMDFGRMFAPLLGWSRARMRAFLDLEDPSEQLEFWNRYLDTGRFRTALDALFSITALRAVYAPSFLAFLPPRFGAVLRGRMARCFARCSNRRNPYARALLLGELSDEAPPPEAKQIRLVHADAASFLESQPAQSFDGFTLSNILDGASPSYRMRLYAAVRHAAAPGAVTIVRSFAEPDSAVSTNRAAQDRAMLWGIVDVRLAAELDSG